MAYKKRNAFHAIFVALDSQERITRDQGGPVDLNESIGKLNSQSPQAVGYQQLSAVTLMADGVLLLAFKPDNVGDLPHYWLA
jgi:hypothetical protein